MRVISILIMFIVLGLSIKPCCSASLNKAESETVSNIDDCCESRDCKESESESNSKENKSCNFCSPFFTCGSCSGFTYQDIIIHFNSPFIELKKVFSFYDVHVNSEYKDKMWQPPKF